MHFALFCPCTRNLFMFSMVALFRVFVFLLDDEKGFPTSLSHCSFSFLLFSSAFCLRFWLFCELTFCARNFFFLCLCLSVCVIHLLCVCVCVFVSHCSFSFVSIKKLFCLFIQESTPTNKQHFAFFLPLQQCACMHQIHLALRQTNSQKHRRYKFCTCIN